MTVWPKSRMLARRFMVGENGRGGCDVPAGFGPLPHQGRWHMNDEPAFLQAMQQNPTDTTLRLIFADWLEEQGDPRAELLRLMHTLTQSVEVPNRRKVEERLRSLLAAGVQPVGPFWTNSIGMKFAWVSAGTYLMGSPKTEQGRQKNETQ